MADSKEMHDTSISRRAVITGAAGLAAAALGSQALAQGQGGQDIRSQELQEEKAQAVAEQARKWRYRRCRDAQDAADFLNIPTAQGPGEATIALRQGGGIDLLWYA
jgi:hypothetical protein